MSGGIGAQREQVSPRAEQKRQDWWLETLDQVRHRLARIDRGEAWAPDDVVRCLRLLVDDRPRGTRRTGTPDEGRRLVPTPGGAA